MIEDQLLHPLCLQLLERLLQLDARLSLELDDLHIPDLAVEHLRLYALDLDDVPGDRELLRLVPSLAEDQKPHLRVLGAAHLVHGLLDRHVLGPLIVDLQDLVACRKPGAVARRALDRRDDRQLLVLDPDLDADPLELALDVHAHLLERPLGHIGRMRVKARDHAPDGALDQLLGVRVLHVVALDELERLREGLQLVIGIGLGLDQPLPDQNAGQQQHQRSDQKLLFVDLDHVIILHIVMHSLPPEQLSDERPACPGRLLLRQPGQGVLRLAFIAYLEIQLGPFQASRIAHEADGLPLAHPVALGQGDLLQIAVERIKTGAMLDDEKLSVSFVPIRKSDLSVVDRPHRITLVRSDLDAPPEDHGLELGMALHPEARQDLSGHRPGEPDRAGGHRAACRRMLPGTFLPSSSSLWIMAQRLAEDSSSSRRVCSYTPFSLLTELRIPAFSRRRARSSAFWASTASLRRADLLFPARGLCLDGGQLFQGHAVLADDGTVTLGNDAEILQPLQRGIKAVRGQDGHGITAPAHLVQRPDPLAVGSLQAVKLPAHLDVALFHLPRGRLPHHEAARGCRQVREPPAACSDRASRARQGPNAPCHAPA